MKRSIKYVGILSIAIVCMSIIAAPAFALQENAYNYSYPYNYRYGCGYGGYGSAYGSQYGSQYRSPYGYYNYNGYGFRGYDQSRYPGSTEFCTKWIPGHWVSVRVMMPGRWIYRPVWIPSYPRTQYRWVPGFWQTTSYNTRPDVYVWGSQTGGWYGMPYQTYQRAGGGYFNENGLWVPGQK